MHCPTALRTLLLLAALLASAPSVKAQLKVFPSGNTTVGLLNANTARLYVHGTSSTASVLAAVYAGPAGAYNVAAVAGSSVPQMGYGVGGDFSGGNTGVRGVAVGYSSSISQQGVYGWAGGLGASYGVFGAAGGDEIGTFEAGILGYAENGYAGYFAGSVVVSGTLTQSSDRRIKKDVVQIDPNESLGLVLRLRPSSYAYLDEKAGGLAAAPSGVHYGLIAQEVEEVLPSLVSEQVHPVRSPGAANEGGARGATFSDVTRLKGVNYVELVPLLIAAVQAQQAQIDELRAALVAAGIRVPERR